MRQRHIVSLLAALLLAFFSSSALAASDPDTNKDTDTRLVNARVVEVNDAHISVVARTGVEHVIAVDRADTKITLDGRVISLKEVREGDIITVELDAQKQVKYAKNISMLSEQTQVARNRR